MSFKGGVPKNSNLPGHNQRSISNNEATHLPPKDLGQSSAARSLAPPSQVNQEKAPVTSKNILGELYQVPTSYSSIPQAGQDAPVQLFRGMYDDLTQSPGAWYMDEYMIKGGGPHVLLNLDLGPNAKHAYKIPMWVYPDGIPMVNNLIGRAKPGAQWGRIKPLPNLGGENGSGKGARWAVKEIEGKGMGLFALQKFITGDVVVCDRPLLVAPSTIPGLPGLGRHKYYEVLYDRQSEEQQKEYLELFNAKDESASKFEGIVRTNQVLLWPLSDNTQHYDGLFPVISRANHSCGANTVWHFNTETFSLDLHVVRTVEPGEELTVNYGSKLKPKHERQQELKHKYQFVCQCNICSLDATRSVQSDKRRKDLLDWESNHPTLKQWQTDSSYGKLEFVQNQKRRIVTCNVEGLQEITKALLLDLILAYVVLGDTENIKKFGNQTMTMVKATIGANDKIVTSIEMLIKNPQSHPSWNTLALRDVDYLPTDKGKGKSKPTDLEDMLRRVMPADLMAKVDAADTLHKKNTELLKILAVLNKESGSTADSVPIDKFPAGGSRGTPSTKQPQKK